MGFCPIEQKGEQYVPVLVLDHPIVRLCKELDYTKTEFPSHFCHAGLPSWLFHNKIFQLDCSKLDNNEIKLYAK